MNDTQLSILAREAGLAAVGVAPAEPEVTAVFPWARSVICAAICYLPPDRPLPDNAPRGRVAKVAQSTDYHDVLRTRLTDITSRLTEESPIRFEVCVDACPLPERKLAVLAGIAWRGKSGNVFVEGCGSYAALGEIVTDLDLPLSEPLLADRCGDCNLCLSACPTGALSAPYAVDADRCISALTQSPGMAPRDLRNAMGAQVYGCDLCLSACPANATAGPGASEFARDVFPGPCPELIPLIQMTAVEFRENVNGSSIGWIRRTRIRRNAAIAAANLRCEETAPALMKMLSNPEPVLRATAAWALGEIGGDACRLALFDAHQKEPEPAVREEIEQALAAIGEPNRSGEQGGQNQ